MPIVKNAQYEIFNVAAQKYLNLDGEFDGVTNSELMGTTVNLFKRTGSPDQRWATEHWVLDGVVYWRFLCQRCGTNGAEYTFALNRHSENGSCIIWHMDSATPEDTALDLRTINADQMLYRICLAKRTPELYLTAVGNKLYWRPYVGDDTQLFKFYTPGTGPDGGGTIDPPVNPQNGLDTAANCTNIANAIRNSGYSFVGRYICRDANSWKILKAAEVTALHNAGVDIFTFYQDSNNSDSAFSYNIGYEDAGYALQRADDVGQPTGTCIYFAVDYNASATSIRNYIIPYFRGVAERLSGSGYMVGVYGSGAVCQAIKQDEGLATYSCLSKSYAWDGYNDYVANGKYDLLQGAYVTVSDVQFDKETSRTASFGQW